MEKYPVDNPVKKLFQGGDKQENIRLAIDMVRNSTIIPECFDVASDYCRRACSGLKDLPKNKASEVMTNLADFIVSRRN
jgi:geranylgeranyl pyrophosphate synthase